MEIHQYKVKIQKIFIKIIKIKIKNYQKKRKTRERERERVIIFLCDKICMEWKRLVNL